MSQKFADVIKILPKTPGVYKFLGSDKEILYVGKAKSLKKRVSLEEIKKNKNLSSMTLVKQSRLSVSPVSQQEWNLILEISETSL